MSDKSPAEKRSDEVVESRAQKQLETEPTIFIKGFGEITRSQYETVVKCGAIDVRTRARKAFDALRRLVNFDRIGQIVLVLILFGLAAGTYGWRYALGGAVATLAVVGAAAVLMGRQ